MYCQGLPAVKRDFFGDKTCLKHLDSDVLIRRLIQFALQIITGVPSLLLFVLDDTAHLVDFEFHLQVRKGQSHFRCGQ